jgi:hypothetical protein
VVTTAEVTDVDPDLRHLARRVPDDIRASLSKVDLHLRCIQASRLITDAEDTGNDRRRAEAARLLKAASPATYEITMRVLGDERRQAQLDNDDRRAWEISQAMRRYDIANPQPSQETVLAHVQAEVARLKIPPPPPPSRSALGRRFGMKSRKGTY